MCIKGIYYCSEGTRLIKKISEHQTNSRKGKDQKVVENPMKKRS
jgi:hypothetical protein